MLAPPPSAARPTLVKNVGSLVLACMSNQYPFYAKRLVFPIHSYPDLEKAVNKMDGLHCSYKQPVHKSHFHLFPSPKEKILKKENIRLYCYWRLSYVYL